MGRPSMLPWFCVAESGVVPGQLGERIGKLLQPPVIREVAVVKRGRGKEHELQPTPGATSAPARTGGARAAADDARELRERLPGELGDNFRKLTAGKESIMEDAV